MSVENLQRTATEPFTGKTCVVTGSSRGIGREIALTLGEAGANVVVNYRSSPESAVSVVEEIEPTAGTAIDVQADVTDPEDVAALAETVTSAFGSVDVLVNNAGVTADARFEDLDEEAWHRVVDVNLNGVFNCTRQFYDDIRAAENGRLINVSSVVGERGSFGQANYAATKSALFGFTRTLARELAPHGSTANCVAPGYTRTEMVEAVREDVQDRIREDIPLGRFATPAEIASAVEFLASDGASYVTGEVLSVNGGMHV